MLRRKSLDRICQTSHLPKSLSSIKAIVPDTTIPMVPMVYKYIGRWKRIDEKVVSPYTNISCIFDIMFQDLNMTNDIINIIDNIISTKDTIDNSITIGLNTRPAIKRRHKIAIIKLVFMVYKLFIYKILICSLLTKDDHMIRLCIDYINLYLDSVI
jgi:hypothetical protein